jgi:hypothetical protein
MAGQAATGATAGFAARKAAKAAGAPEWVSDLVGTVASIWGYGAASKVGAYLDAESGTPSVLKFMRWQRKGAVPPRPAAAPPPLQGSSLTRREAAEAEEAAAGAKPTAAPPPLKGSSLKERITAQRDAAKAAPKARPPRMQGSSLARREAAEAAKEMADEPRVIVPEQARYSEKELNPSKMTARELTPGKVINAQAAAKNKALAQRFRRLGMNEDQVRNMSESEYEQHRIELNKERSESGLPQLERLRPGPMRRNFTELKNDIVAAMRNGS